MLTVDGVLDSSTKSLRLRERIREAALDDAASGDRSTSPGCKVPRALGMVGVHGCALAGRTAVPHVPIVLGVHRPGDRAKHHRPSAV